MPVRALELSYELILLQLYALSAYFSTNPNTCTSISKSNKYGIIRLILIVKFKYFYDNILVHCTLVWCRLYYNRK